MAKSLRSKWRRRMKAVKRERYGKKETDRLIKMLQEAGDYQVVPKVKEEPMDPVEVPGEEVADVDLEPEPVVTSPMKTRSSSRKLKAVGRQSRRDVVAAKDDDSSDDESKDGAAEEVMDTVDDPSKVERVYSKKTKRDQFGNYPAWMSVRKINKQKKKNKRLHSKRVKLRKAKM